MGPGRGQRSVRSRLRLSTVTWLGWLRLAQPHLIGAIMNGHESAQLTEVRNDIKDIDRRLMRVEEQLNSSESVRNQIFESLRDQIESLGNRLGQVQYGFLGAGIGMLGIIVALILGSYFLIGEVTTLNANVSRLGERVTQNQLRLEERVQRAEEAAEQQIEETE